MNRSVQTINSPEFINLQPLDINPLMSACEIKVLYVGGNRNGSFITKEVATEMAKTLRGAPIVGYWRKEVEDFGDHGERVIIDGDGIKFECLTTPYGFVAPDAKVWFQTFVDTNDFGEEIEREYLMTTGFLWTGQFPECRSAVEGEGKPHSMELDKDTLDGHWALDTKGMDFFIIDDAIFSKLCILGEDVEPCFEGSSVKRPEVSASFAKVDDNFKQTLFSMMRDLQFALQGGQQMDDTTIVVETPVVEPATEPVVEPATEPVVEPTTEPEAEPAQEPATDDGQGAPAAIEDPVPAEPAQEPAEPQDPVTEPAAEPATEPVVEPTVEPVAEPAPQEPDQYAQLEAAHAELQAQYDELSAQFTALQATNESLTAQIAGLTEYRARIENAEKDAMIKKFFMLSDELEEKKEIVANKASYSLEEIEEKLSVLCFRHKVNFDLENTSKNHNTTEASVVTFNLSGAAGASQPAWLSAVDNYKNKI